MHYVYIIESAAEPTQRYIGYSADLANRMRYHNAGKSPHTAKYRPWRLLFYSAFPSKQTALVFVSKRLLTSCFALRCADL